MENNSLIKTIIHVLKLRGSIDITIRGNSMEPTLSDGDIVTIVKKDNYCVGDILVFNYKSEGLIAHRLLDINNAYFCKGDNSFRFEKIKKDDILGKIIDNNCCNSGKWPSWKCEFSKKIGNIFIERKDVIATQCSYEYILYSLTVLKSNKRKIIKLIDDDSLYSDIDKNRNFKGYSQFTVNELKLIFAKLNLVFEVGDLIEIISKKLKSHMYDIDELCLYIIVDFMNLGLIMID